jgi:hypothetical protein
MLSRPRVLTLNPWSESPVCSTNKIPFNAARSSSRLKPVINLDGKQGTVPLRVRRYNPDTGDSAQPNTGRCLRTRDERKGVTDG